MKKILSTILLLTMIFTLVAAMGITISAKEGDLLYEVNFNGDDKYAPGAFACQNGEVLDAVPSEDGKSVTVTYKADATTGRAFWGGTIQGLTYGEGKQYTITMKMAIKTYTNGSGALVSGNAGVNINMPKNTESQYLFDQGYQYLVGYYGCPNIRHTLSSGAGARAIGALLSNDTYITDAKYLSTVDSDGFVDMTFAVDGKNVKLYINNVYIDEYDAFNTGLVEMAGNLGLSVYLYNREASITLKDAKIYAGIIVSDATYPDYYVEGPAVANYETAKTGDLIFSADFSRKDTGFSPRFLAGNGSKFAVTSDLNNKNYVKFEQDGSAAAGTYYGSVVRGLEVNSQTQYTTEYKVKTGLHNSGFCFAVPTIQPFSKSFNIYGDFLNKKFATQHGSNKINNVNGTAGSDGFVQVTDLAYDTDGYATFRVEMDGYNATIYYLGTSGQWISYNKFNMINTTKVDGSTTFIHEAGFQLCVGFYLHNKGLVVEYKDINIFKGLLISDSLDTKPEKPAEHIHKLVYTAAKAATATEDGNLEYWYCAGCDCYFTDGQGKYNVPRLSLIIPKVEGIVNLYSVPTERNLSTSYSVALPYKEFKPGDVVTMGPVSINATGNIVAFRSKTDGKYVWTYIKRKDCTQKLIPGTNAYIVQFTVPDISYDRMMVYVSAIFRESTVVTVNRPFTSNEYLEYLNGKGIDVSVLYPTDYAGEFINVFPKSDSAFAGRLVSQKIDGKSTLIEELNEKYYTSALISVKEGDIITLAGTASNAYYSVYFFDEANSFSSYATSNTIRYYYNSKDDCRINVLVVPKGSTYMRVVVHKAAYEMGNVVVTVNQPMSSLAAYNSSKEIKVSGLQKEYTYTGAVIKPKVVLKIGGNVLKLGKDYKLKYDDKNVGVKKLTVTFTGNYAYLGEAYIAYTIVPKKVDLVWENTSMIYNGEIQSPTAKVNNLAKGDICNVTVSGIARDAGTYAAAAIALDNPNYVLSDNVTCNFTIAPKAVELVWENVSMFYTGRPQTPTAKAIGLVNGDICNVTVVGSGEELGSYVATAIALSNANYTLPQNTSCIFNIIKSPVHEAVGLPAEFVIDVIAIVPDSAKQAAAEVVTETVNVATEAAKEAVNAATEVAEAAVSEAVESVSNAFENIFGNLFGFFKNFGW